MAIAYDNSKTWNYVPPAVDTTYTIGTESYRYLFACGSGNLTSATYNGVSMTKIIDYEPSIHDGNQQKVVVYGLANPDSGTNTFTPGMSGNGTISMVSYSGVDSVQPEDTNEDFTNDGSSNTQATTFSTSITTVSNNAWTVMFSSGGNNLQTMTATQGTLRVSGIYIFGDGARTIIDSNTSYGSPTSSTLEATWAASSGFMSNVIISMKPSFESKGTFMPYFI